MVTILNNQDCVSLRSFQMSWLDLTISSGNIVTKNSGKSIYVPRCDGNTLVLDTIPMRHAIPCKTEAII